MAPTLKRTAKWPNSPSVECNYLHEHAPWEVLHNDRYCLTNLFSYKKTTDVNRPHLRHVM